MDPLQNQTYFLPPSRYPQQMMQSSKCLSRQHSSTLKDLLQKPTQQFTSKSSLSPNGTFKYVKRQHARAYYNNYGTVLKSPLFTTQERVRRPLNCFMVFSHLERRRVAEEHPELHNADLSKILGKRWKTLTPIEKQPYIDEAERIRQLHTEIYPDYKYQPRRKSQVKRIDRKSDDENTLEDDEQSKATDEKTTTTTTTDIKDVEEATTTAATQSTTTTTATTKATLMHNKDYLKRYDTSSTFVTKISTTQEILSCYQNQRLQNNYQAVTNNFNNQQQQQQQQQTPDISPTSYYGNQDTLYNSQPTTPQHHDAGNGAENALRSFPPTPEVSPIMLNNREDSVFAFDLPHYIPTALHQQQNNHQSLRNTRTLNGHHQNTTSMDLVACNLQQQQSNDPMCYQNYYPTSSMDYYYGSGGGYQNEYTAQHQLGAMHNNLQKNEMTNSLSNILDSLQNENR